MENLTYRIKLDKNLQYVAESGVVDEMGIFDVFATIPATRCAKQFVRRLKDNMSTLNVFEWSICIELSADVTRKQNHVRLEQFARDVCDMHESRRSY